MFVNKGFTFLPGRGNKSGNYIFVDDVVDGHLLAMEKGESGEKYILGGENVTMNEFMQIVREVSGRKGIVFRMPLFVLFGLAKFHDWKARFLKRPPLITTPFTRRYLVNWSNSNVKAKDKLGFKPLTLREGIEKTIEWIRSERNPRRD
jgi:nucleoside-diphosphate-sugar epimerase